MIDEPSDWLTDAELTSLRNKLFILTGKAVYLYQEVERRIKLLSIATSLEFSGHPDSWEEQLASLQDSLSKKTLGQLMGKLFESLHSDTDHLNETGKNVASLSPKFQIRFRFSLQATSDYLRERKLIIESFVEERNHLVHHSFEAVKFSDRSGLVSAIDLLEKKLERAEQEVQQLNQLVTLLKESFLDLSDFWDSNSGKLLAEKLSLQSSLPISYLEQYAISKGVADGWCVFQSACNDLDKLHKTEVDKLKSTYSFKTLLKAAEACGLFEFKVEATVKGSRLLYRTLTTDYEYKAS